MAQWSIVIWELDGQVQFTPRNLNVSAGDQVSWSNQTGKEHTIAILAEVMRPKHVSAAAGRLSNPAYEIPSSIRYSCRDDDLGAWGTIPPMPLMDWD